MRVWFSSIPYDFQEKLIERFHDNRFNICKMPRQTGKSTTVYILSYYIMLVFNDSVNIGILANKAATARDLLGRLQLHMRIFLSGCSKVLLAWNKGSLELENGSKILASIYICYLLFVVCRLISSFLDEFAFVPNHIADSISLPLFILLLLQVQTTKVIMVSTPRGMNHFYRYVA